MSNKHPYHRRPSPRERIAKHLLALGVTVHEDDIQQLHGSRSMQRDVLGGWEVHGRDAGGIAVSVSSPYTMSRCARGIRLEVDPGRFCLYGDAVAIPSNIPLLFSCNLWKPRASVVASKVSGTIFLGFEGEKPPTPAEIEAAPLLSSYAADEAAALCNPDTNVVCQACRHEWPAGTVTCLDACCGAYCRPKPKPVKP